MGLDLIGLIIVSILSIAAIIIIVIIGLSAALLPRIFEILAKMILARPSNFITYSFVYFIQRKSSWCSSRNFLQVLC